MDATLSFFMFLTVYLFALGLKSEKGRWFIFMGISSGLALLTKYTGVLALVSIVLFTFARRRELFSNKAFVSGLVLSVVMMLPWFFWNYKVYGGGFFLLQQSFHYNRRLVHWVVFAVLFGIGFWALSGIMRTIMEKTGKDKTDASEMPAVGISRNKVNIAIGIFLIGSVYQSIIYGFPMDYLPRTSWSSFTFKVEPPSFYVGQLIEYSLIYIFAFAALLVSRKDHPEERALLRYGSIITLVFFTAWRSFQCRYILFAIPFLAILGIELIRRLFEKIDDIDHMGMRTILRGGLAFLVVYALGKMVYIDIFLSFTNDMCYF